ncbi:hypothetical protein B0J17DRAFT_723453 [Rhizoctonia solani]|nr:hypothetical protein B0J17DRAFT_723453 [Rhizoctonia solani]
MRQQLDDAISSFLVRAMLELLSQAPSTDNSLARDTLPGRRSGVPSLSPPGSSNRSQGPYGDSQLRRRHIPRPQIINPLLSTMNASKSRLCDRAEVPIQPMDGPRHMNSNEFSVCSASLGQSEQHPDDPTREETHTNRLAATLYRLSDQMASVGDLDDALALSQGAAGLYRAQAERQLALYYQNRN